MFGHSSNLPVGGSILLAAATYAAISAFVTDPLVAERTIERGGWESSCRADLKHALAAEESAGAPDSLPSFDCNALLGLFGPEARQICRLPGIGQIEAQQRQMREIRQRRLEAAIGNVASRCACAAAATVETRRIPFAIYARSVRLITPAPVRNLQSELQASLRSPLCASQE